MKTHLLHAFSKLGVSDRTAVVTAALARKLIPLPGSGAPYARHNGRAGLLRERIDRATGSRQPPARMT